MIAFDLDRAHPWYRFVIRNQIWTLVDKYPQAPLKRVRIYRPASADDRSLGNANENGVISLNEHWFAQPPEVLQREAENWPLMPLGGGRFIKWHGNMLKEPEHCGTHEFFHVLAEAIPDIDEFSTAGWLNDTENPDEAVSGYALADPAEWWAESATAAELGFKAPDIVARRLIEIQMRKLP